MKTKYKYIQFDCESTTGKTDIWSISNNKNEYLGEVKWYAPWRQYCYYPEYDYSVECTVLAGNCLIDIADFIKQLMDERRKK